MFISASSQSLAAPVKRIDTPGQPGPFAPPPPQISRDFTATTGRSASERRNRYSMPPVSAVGTLPLATFGACDPGRRFRRSPSHVPCQSRRPGSRRLHAGHHLASNQDNRQAPHGRTAKSPAFDTTSITLTTPQQRTPTPEKHRDRALSGTSSWSPPDASSAPFPRSLTTTIFSQRSTGRFSAFPEGRRWRANKPPSPAQHRL
jgi:hypothetical protein